MEKPASKEELTFNGPNKEVVNIFACTNCGANLNYKPGTKTLHCQYCGSDNEIPEEAGAKVSEHDFNTYISQLSATSSKMEISVVNCINCAATTTVDPHIKSATCPYCATPLVVASSHAEEFILPGGILPFKIDKDQAKQQFKNWVKRLWFAPNDLKRAAHDTDRFNGVYIPYWTFDSETSTSFTGQRGVYYYVSESYTATENGQSVTKTRQVRKTRWHNVSGNLDHFFDDVLVIASHSLPLKYAERLEPWDLHHTEAFQEAYLGGFITEKYQVELKEGFSQAKSKMEPVIRTMVRNQIGGDEQRILSMSPYYNKVTFKHLLLPVFISAFRYKNKAYQFLVNGRTGEVQGERPYSTMKIVLLILAVLLVLGIAFFFMVSRS